MQLEEEIKDDLRGGRLDIVAGYRLSIKCSVLACCCSRVVTSAPVELRS
jgi:hypothetical protein